MAAGRNIYLHVLANMAYISGLKKLTSWHEHRSDHSYIIDMTEMEGHIPECDEGNM